MNRLLTLAGRTGRIGHRGLASSFYTDRDESIASVLTRTLLETEQQVPDFLESYRPEDAEKLKFEADSDFEDDADGAQDDAQNDGQDETSFGDQNGDKDTVSDNGW